MSRVIRYFLTASLAIATSTWGGDLIVKGGGSFKVNPRASIILPTDGIIEIQDSALGELDDGTLDAHVTVRDGGFFSVCGIITGDFLKLGTVVAGCDPVVTGNFSQAGGGFSGILGPRIGEQERYPFTLTQPSTIRFSSSLSADTTVTLFSGNDGSKLGGNDDGGGGGNFQLRSFLLPGSYVFDIGWLGGDMGDYEFNALIDLERIQPDAQTGNTSVKFVGRNIYNVSGARQVLSLTANTSGKASFYVAGQNDGTVKDDLVFKTNSNPRSSLLVTRLTGGRRNVSAAISKMGYTEVDVAPGQTVLFKVRFRGGNPSKGNRRYRFQTDVISGLLGDRRDRVVARVFWPQS